MNSAGIVRFEVELAMYGVRNEHISCLNKGDKWKIKFLCTIIIPRAGIGKRGKTVWVSPGLRTPPAVINLTTNL